jgi:hypothetical protein
MQERIRCEFLFKIESPSAVPEFLDRMLRDRQFQALRHQLARMTSLDAAKRALTSIEIPKSLRDVAGAEHAVLLEEAFRLEHVLVGSLLVLIGQTSMDPKATRLATRETKPMEWMENPILPPEFKRGMLALERTSICMFALDASHDRGIELWLIRSLFENWISSARAALRVFASFPGTNIPKELVPSSERLDWDKLVEEVEEAEAGYQARLSAARASGADIFPPLPGPLDD